MVDCLTNSLGQNWPYKNCFPGSCPVLIQPSHPEQRLGTMATVLHFSPTWIQYEWGPLELCHHIVQGYPLGHVRELIQFLGSIRLDICCWGCPASLFLSSVIESWLSLRTVIPLLVVHVGQWVHTHSLNTQSIVFHWLQWLVQEWIGDWRQTSETQLVGFSWKHWKIEFFIP